MGRHDVCVHALAGLPTEISGQKYFLLVEFEYDPLPAAIRKDNFVPRKSRSWPGKKQDNEDVSRMNHAEHRYYYEHV
ncbi:MAG: hypothetical protein ACKVHO_12760 [Verrucomicrobiia bacterium]